MLLLKSRDVSERCGGGPSFTASDSFKIFLSLIYSSPTVGDRGSLSLEGSPCSFSETWSARARGQSSSVVGCLLLASDQFVPGQRAFLQWKTNGPRARSKNRSIAAGKFRIRREQLLRLLGDEQGIISCMHASTPASRWWVRANT
jgi:hypothetical protein